MKRAIAAVIVAILGLVTTGTMADNIKDLPTKVVGGHTLHYYKVQPKETIYSLCHKFDISTDYLRQTNPSVDDGLKSGQTLYFPLSEQPHTQTTHPAAPALHSTAQIYKVEKGETFYSIARKFSVPVSDLEAANPGVAVLQAGQILSIPGEKPLETANPPLRDSAQSPSDMDNPADTAGNFVITVPADNRIEIAVLLPFMLSEETVGKEARRATEFYKGLLIAVDSMRHAGTPVTVRAYDTEGRSSRVNVLLTHPELKNASIIIAPDDPEQLDMIARFGSRNSIMVLNPFQVRGDTYRYNPYVIQVNTPSEIMLQHAANALAGHYAGYVPVFLTRTDGPMDKDDFIYTAKGELSARGVDYLEIPYAGRLTRSALRDLDSEGRYIFIPSSGKQAEANRFMPALKEWRDAQKEADKGRIRVFGYPEWVTFRGGTLDLMHDLGAVIYSRFDGSEPTGRASEVNNRFRSYYGSPTEAASPRQGFLGFDLGMFLLRALPGTIDELEDRLSDIDYAGIQTPISLERDNSRQGWHNSLIYLLYYRPDGLVEPIKK